ncbi:MAG: hypothetical protein KatS3mg097_246 [Candidatus Parcubacteria bacterium]|nr:MAG: hypothetical protein KatS3mg097_246 [Candidatus Parcubacteria bacterium]
MFINELLKGFFQRKTKGQITFLLVNLILIFIIFFIIILGNLSIVNLNFNREFNQYIVLKSLVFSGLNYSLYNINKNPNFATTNAIFVMPSGNYFRYSVVSLNSTTKVIDINGYLTSSELRKNLKATVTIDLSGGIIDLNFNEY